MPTVTLTQAYSDLGDWPGRLFEPDENTVVSAATATTYSLRHGSTSDFAGFQILVTGSAFTYLGGVATGGTISTIRVLNPAGATILTISGLAAATAIANDLSQFASNMFGDLLSNEGPGPNGYMAWNHLLVGNDIISGTSGNDREQLVGLDSGNDVYNMGAGDDRMFGGAGNDTYNGGSGQDQLTFRETTYDVGGSAFRGARIDVTAQTVIDPWGGSDRFTSIEEFGGSRFNDGFIGTAVERDDFSGMRGRDALYGGAASFNASGQRIDDWNDRARYSDDYWQGGRFGIVVDLETSFANGSIRGTVRDGFGNTDTLVDIERVVGTRYNDNFIGSRTDNEFVGGEGRDTFSGGSGSDELIFDWWFVDPAPGSVNINLSLSSGQVINDGFGNTETAVSIENVRGSDRNDTIRGSSATNYIEGENGTDTLAGAGGSDVFVWTVADEFGDSDRITDFGATGSLADRLAFEIESFAGMTSTLRLVNGTAATSAGGTFIFNATTDQLSWDSDGTGAAARTIIAVLPNVAALSSINFELWD